MMFTGDLIKFSRFGATFKERRKIESDEKCVSRKLLSKVNHQVLLGGFNEMENDEEIIRGRLSCPLGILTEPWLTTELKLLEVYITKDKNKATHLVCAPKKHGESEAMKRFSFNEKKIKSRFCSFFYSQWTEWAIRLWTTHCTAAPRRKMLSVRTMRGVYQKVDFGSEKEEMKFHPTIQVNQFISKCHKNKIAIKIFMSVWGD